MLSTTIRDSQERLVPNWRPRLQLAAMVATACSLGWMIASERWFLVASAFGLLLLLLRPIEVTLGLYAFLIPFEPVTTMGNGTSTSPAPTLLRYVGLLALFVTLGVGWLRGRIGPPRTALFWSLFMVWGGVSTLWAIDQEMALHRLPMALGLWLLYMAIVSVRLTAKEFSCIVLLTIAGGVGASIYFAYGFFRMGDAVGDVFHTTETLSDPDFFSATLLLPLSLCVGGVLSSCTWLVRALFLAATGVITLALFLTMSRGALAALTGITFIFLLRLRLNWKLLLPVATAGTALTFMPPLFFQRVHEASTSRISGRLDIWQVGIHSLKSYGALGAGLDNFPNAFQRYVGTARFFAGDQRSSHNIYLTAAVEFGILGILFLFEAVRSHLRAFPTPTRNIPETSRFVAFEAACWGMLIMGFSLDILWRKGFWFVWALSAVAVQVQRENQQLSPVRKPELFIPRAFPS
jgi:O-antigen ligase